MKTTRHQVGSFSSGGGEHRSSRPNNSRTRIYRLSSLLVLVSGSPSKRGTPLTSLLILAFGTSALPKEHSTISDARESSRVEPTGADGWATVAQHLRYSALGGESVSRLVVVGS